MLACLPLFVHWLLVVPRRSPLLMLIFREKSTMQVYAIIMLWCHGSDVPLALSPVALLSPIEPHNWSLFQRWSFSIPYDEQKCPLPSVSLWETFCIHPPQMRASSAQMCSVACQSPFVIVAWGPYHVNWCGYCGLQCWAPFSTVDQRYFHQRWCLLIEVLGNQSLHAPLVEGASAAFYIVMENIQFYSTTILLWWSH